MAARLRLGARGSPLALAQAREVRDRLAAAHPTLDRPGAIEIVAIRTSGDRGRTAPPGPSGGKGLFTREIQDALIDGRIDVAVHSMKDVPTPLPDGLVIDAVPPREDPRDALISPGADSLDALPAGARVGTSSPRRKAILLHRRPDLEVAPLRGNVETRLRKLAEGEAAAILLAVAGLKRIGRAEAATRVLEPAEFLPAACQGALGVECRAGDRAVRALLAAIHHPPSGARTAAERALLAALGGSCRTPIAAHATLDGDRLDLAALIARPDGAERIETARTGRIDDAEALGRDAADELRRRAGADFFDD